MNSEKCGHGKTYKEDCIECEKVSLQGTISSFKPMVEKAESRLREITELEKKE
jgi:hypothetical protein